MTGSVWTPKIDLGGCILYAPFWHPTMCATSGSILSKNISPKTITLTNAPTWGKYGYTFDGTNNYMTIPNGMLDLTGNYTVSVWVNLSSFAAQSGAQRRIITLIGSDTSAFDLAAFATGTTFTFRRNVDSGTRRLSGTVCVVNTWYHLVVVWNGAYSFYINGVADTISDAGITTNTASSYIGTTDGVSGMLGGMVGEIAVFTRALTASNIGKLFQTTQWRYKS